MEPQFEFEALAALEAELARNVANVNQVLSQRMFEKHGITRNVEMAYGRHMNASSDTDLEAKFYVERLYLFFKLRIIVYFSVIVSSLICLSTKAKVVQLCPVLHQHSLVSNLH
ncbi:hypothetical protein M514_16411 [Trichuris suis]|uniref:Uncharacterized protein n=1 Tax=Trichuris suis TaxID=68888 RepID=A0A085NPT3_9BILA|nr:hypothetical protein M514_16411 [Trichuris suis]